MDSNSHHITRSLLCVKPTDNVLHRSIFVLIRPTFILLRFVFISLLAWMCPAWVAQWLACRAHDLVVVSSIPVEGTFLSGVFLPLTSAEAREKVFGGFGKKSCVSASVRQPGNTYASPTAMT